MEWKEMEVRQEGFACLSPRKIKGISIQFFRTYCFRVYLRSEQKHSLVSVTYLNVLCTL